MNRRRLALASLLVVVALAGCLGGGEIPEEDLTGEQTYEWETDAMATFNLSASADSYTAVVEVRNRSNLTIHQRSAFTGDNPVDVRALKFRFPNGTVVNATHDGLSATRRDDDTRITLPADDGTVAYTASRNRKQFTTPVFVDGSYRVDLPESTRVGIPLLSRARPRGYDTTLSGDRMTVRWDELEQGSVSVRYYLVRDLYLFGGLFALASMLGIGGALYYFREIRQLQKRREEVGLDVDYEDDEFDDGPPPGMG